MSRHEEWLDSIYDDDDNVDDEPYEDYVKRMDATREPYRYPSELLHDQRPFFNWRTRWKEQHPGEPVPFDAAYYEGEPPF